MKHFLIILLGFFYLNTSLGQLKKDNWLLMGGGSFYAFKQESTGTNLNYYTRELNATFLSSIGYFVADKFVIGIGNRVNGERYKLIGQDVGIKNFRWSLGPFLRYYFLPDEKSFNFFTDIDYQLGVNSNFGEYKGKHNLLSVSPGLELFFNSTVGLHLKMGYSNKVTSSYKNPSKEEKSVRNGFESSIGISIHLEK